MKFKLFNLLAVGVATLGGLAASQSAFGHSVEQQKNLEQVQYLVCVKERGHSLCDIDKSGERNSESARAVAVKQGKAALDLNSSNVNVVPQLLNPEQQKSIANIVLWFGYLVPFSACLGIFLYDKYGDYRSTILNKQIEMLETLWKQDF
jgi:hypothetical protein